MKKLIYAALAFSPILAFAQNIGTVQTSLGSFSSSILQIINHDVIPVIFALAIVYFFWGLAKFVLGAADPKAQAEGKSIMIWGIVALVIMASVYGLIAFFQSSTGLTAGTAPTLPGGGSLGQ
jgi:hypothetical protein